MFKNLGISCENAGYYLWENGGFINKQVFVFSWLGINMVFIRRFAKLLFTGFSSIYHLLDHCFYTFSISFIKTKYLIN